MERQLLIRPAQIISLDNCHPMSISKQQLDIARDIAMGMKGQVWLASQPEVLTQTTQGMDKVTQDVFGGLLITDKIEIARAIAYNSQLKLNCVTLDGDVVKSNGMMSGGYHKKQNSPFIMWTNYEEFKEQDSTVKKMRAEYDDFNKKYLEELEKLREKADLYDQVKSDHSRMEHRLAEFNITNIQSKIQRIQQEIVLELSEIQKIETEIENLKKETAENDAEIKKCQQGEVKDIAKERTKLQEEIKKLEKELQHVKSKFMVIENGEEEYQRELDRLDESIDRKTRQVSEMRSKISEQQRQLDELDSSTKEIQRTIDEI